MSTTKTTKQFHMAIYALVRNYMHSKDKNSSVKQSEGVQYILKELKTCAQYCSDVEMLESMERYYKKLAETLLLEIKATKQSQLAISFAKNEKSSDTLQFELNALNQNTIKVLKRIKNL